MPIYEYQCNQCEAEFELLIRSNQEKIVCPHCRSLKLSRLFSRFASFSKDAGGNITSTSGCNSCVSRNCSSCGR